MAEARVASLASHVSLEPYSEDELALIRRQTAEIELPPELEAWFSQLAGCVETSLKFDSRTDRYRDEGAHGDDY